MNHEITYVHTELKEKSGFFPKHQISAPMEIFNQSVMKDIEQHSTTYKYNYNCTIGELKALNDLEQDQSIIIKPADKGGGIVILPIDMYIKEAFKQLHDTNVYIRLKGNPIEYFRRSLTVLLDKGLKKGILNKKEYDYLSITYPKTPVFYLLPKIHKDVNQPPGRPIVSGISSSTSRLSEYMYTLLQPIVTQQPAYLKDTIHILRILTDIVWEPGYLLVTSDVTSLYTILQL